MLKQCLLELSPPVQSVHDVQKSNYLRAQLRKGADRVIAGLLLTNANYEYLTAGREICSTPLDNQHTYASTT